MGRLHLFELEDQSWFPAFLRDACTGYLSQIVRWTGMMSAAVPFVARCLEGRGERAIVDLCSGAGAPASLLVTELRKSGHEVSVHCTDLFPNQAALARTASRSHGAVSYSPESIDATRVPEALAGVRTLFNAFHHFPPATARRILEDAVSSAQPIAVFEFVGRSPAHLLGMGGVPLAVLATLPTIRPFRWLWVPFTYLLPVIPLAVLWDGVVSCLRVYDPDELDGLVRGLDDFSWETGRFRLPRSPGLGTYLIGCPRQPGPAGE